jgi:hypothetical protein
VSACLSACNGQSGTSRILDEAVEVGGYGTRELELLSMSEEIEDGLNFAKGTMAIE